MLWEVLDLGAALKIRSMM